MTTKKEITTATLILIPNGWNTQNSYSAKIGTLLYQSSQMTPGVIKSCKNGYCKIIEDGPCTTIMDFVAAVYDDLNA